MFELNILTTNERLIYNLTNLTLKFDNQLIIVLRLILKLWFKEVIIAEIVSKMARTIKRFHDFCSHNYGILVIA